MADFVITITIPEAARVDFLEAYAERFGYVHSDGVDKEQFARSSVIDMVQDPLHAYRRQRAEATALAAVIIPDDGITA